MSDTSSNAHEFTVSELSNSVKNAIEDQFGFVRVRGEVGRLSRPGSGHLYFDLKDDRSVLAAVAWKGVASRWRFQPEQGLEVVVTGKLTTFAGQSKYQIIVENVEPAGVGALMALLEERRKKLEAEGLFAPEHKQDLPYLPRVIGVVTSPSGAVIRDILHRLDDRFPTHVIVWPVRVQGEQCAPEVANAIEGFNMLPPDGPISRPDLLIVARGGGSVEDLWGFNEEAVVRAISQSEIPIISAIGHETDVTLADFAADKRAPTPTGAAEMAVPVRAELIAYVDDLGARTRSGMRNLTRSNKDRLRAASAALPRPIELVGEARQRLDLAASRLTSALRNTAQAKSLRLARSSARIAPTLLQSRIIDARQKLTNASRSNRNALTAQLRTASQRLQQIERSQALALSGLARHAQLKFTPVTNRLAPAIDRLLNQSRNQLTQQVKLLDTLSYRNVLTRGFALVTDDKGQIIRAADQVSEGDNVQIELADGRVAATVGQTMSVSKTPAKPKKPARPDKNADDERQDSLF